MGLNFTSITNGFDANPATGLVLEDVKLQVLGQLYTGSRGIDFWSSLGTNNVYNNNQIWVASSGVVSGGTLGIITESGSNNTIVNDGQVTGGETGIQTYGGSNFVIRNSGSIDGLSNAGIVVNCEVDTLGDPNTMIVNLATGTISGRESGIALEANAGGSQISNLGFINSDLGYGVNLSNVIAGQGLVTVINSGTIQGGIGAFLGSANADSLTNRGEMTGAVSMGDGADTLDSSTGTITGRVDGGAGDDELTGGAGIERMMGGTGNDTIDLGGGNDLFIAGNTESALSDGNDDLDGGDGIDTYDARDVTTSVTIRLHEQRANGTGIGIDLVQFFENAFGGSGADSLGGDAGRNVLKGGGGGDSLNGLEGNDRLFGNSGIDILVGNIGRDVMTGGADADTFDFNNVTDSGTGDSNRDIITDFTQGADKIDLATIDANTLAAGNQAFAFIGTGAFTNAAGQLRFANSASAQYTTVEGDVNGDGKADFSIGLFGNIVLAAGDFIL